MLLPVAAIAADAGEAEEQVRAQTNDFRRAQGLEPLEADAELQAAARDFARFMAKTGKYSHAADERKPSQRATAHGYEPCIVAENIARLWRSDGYGTDALARDMVEGWKKSPGHRRNMLDANVTEIGVGIAQGGDGRYYGVQLFGRPRSEALRFSVRNEAGRPVSYRIGERRFELAPRVERTHLECRAPKLRVELGERDFTAAPSGGERYVVRRRESGLAVVADAAR